VQSLPLVVVGFLLGMMHATDADHVVAVSTIVSRERGLRGAASVGLLWGAGHSVTVFACGTAIILFNLVIPAQLEQTLEFCVAVMLVVLGVLTLSWVAQQVRGRLTSAVAAGMSAGLWGTAVSLEIPGQPDNPAAAQQRREPLLGRLDLRLGGFAGYRALRPVLIGIVHGLAGSAAVALLVLAQIHEPAWAVAYLILFGVGTTAGMMLITALIAVPFLRTRRMPGLNFAMQVLGGVLSVGLGCYMAWRIGVTDGLFVALRD
jgi:high-affinity nickel-transport protein